MAADCKPRVGSVHIGDEEEQCGITQHIYYLLNIYWISTEYLLCTESPHFATSRSSTQFRKLSWVPWRLQYTTLSGEAVPLLTVVSDWHTNILLASIICHLDLELEHGWITNNKYVSGLFFIQVASHQEWYLDHEVPLQLAGLGPDLDVVPHLHHEQAPLPHQHRGRQPGPERKY